MAELALDKEDNLDNRVFVKWERSDVAYHLKTIRKVGKGLDVAAANQAVHHRQLLHAPI